MKPALHLVSYFLFVSIILTIFAALSFTPVPDKTSATVNQVKGISVFILSTPKQEYETLGEVKITFSMSGKNEYLLNSLAEKARDKYPTSQGILCGLDFEKATVIKFK